MKAQTKYDARGFETFAERSILFKVKEGEDFSRRNTFGILRTKI